MIQGFESKSIVPFSLTLLLSAAAAAQDRAPFAAES
jgi:hypothetical protein